jgi:hypothetical protein
MTAACVSLSLLFTCQRAILPLQEKKKSSRMTILVIIRSKVNTTSSGLAGLTRHDVYRGFFSAPAFVSITVSR